MVGDPAAAERACQPTSTDSRFLPFFKRKKRNRPPSEAWTRFGVQQRVWRRATCLRCSRCGTHTTTTACTQMFSLHSLLLPHRVSLLYCLHLLSPEKVVMCCLQDVFGGAWDFCAAKFGSDVRNRDKVCVLARVASICRSSLHSAPLPPRTGRVRVLACSESCASGPSAL